MAIRSEAMPRAWIDSATTTCLFIDSSLGFHCGTDAPRPLCLAPAFSIYLFLSHAPSLVLCDHVRNNTIQYSLANVRLGFPITKEVLPHSMEAAIIYFLTLA